ncbi:hypothetical protein BGS_0745 [Beggiatoa sp. SS]|nr:hypothetical protein BGS_0745 [Beggiatoa sp. SS]
MENRAGNRIKKSWVTNRIRFTALKFQGGPPPGCFEFKNIFSGRMLPISQHFKIGMILFISHDLGPVFGPRLLHGSSD